MRNVSIDRTAMIAEGAQIGEGCKIGPWCWLGPEVELGPRCQLGARVRITGRVSMGPDNIIRSGALIGLCEDSPAGQDKGRVEIGRGNTIREYSIIYGSSGSDDKYMGADSKDKMTAAQEQETFTEGISAYNEEQGCIAEGIGTDTKKQGSIAEEIGDDIENQRSAAEKISADAEEQKTNAEVKDDSMDFLKDCPTSIDDDNLIMAYTVIKSGARLESGINIANAVVIGSGAVIQEKAFLGGMAQVQEGIILGRLSMLGGHSLLTEDLPPFLLADGNPARVRGLNIIALRRAGYTRSDLRELKKIYRKIYRSGDQENQKIKRSEDSKSKQAKSKQAKSKQAGSPANGLEKVGEADLIGLKNNVPETEAGKELQEFLLTWIKTD